MSSALSSSFYRQARSLISSLSAAKSTFNSYAGPATRFDSPGYLKVHEVAEHFSRSTNSKIGICPAYAFSARRLVHSSPRTDFEQGRDFRPMDFGGGVVREDMRRDGFTNPRNNFEQGRDFRPADFGRGVVREDMRRDGFSNPRNNFEQGRDFRSMDFVRGVVQEDMRRDGFRNPFQFPRATNVEQDVDIVHIKILKNNTFVTVTDSKGNKKIGASSGCLPELKAKASRYASEATAEHVGRVSRTLGLKSVVMRVKGFTYFKKKRQAIMAWKEGFTTSKAQRSGYSPIAYIEDATRRPHNGCRLPRKVRK